MRARYAREIRAGVMAAKANAAGNINRPLTSPLSRIAYGRLIRRMFWAPATPTQEGNTTNGKP